MNMNPYFRTSSVPATLFFYHSAIPGLIYLYCLVRLSGSEQMLPALLLSLVIGAFFELVVARRATVQPFWLLACSVAAGPLASVVIALTTVVAPADYGLDSPIGRARLVYEAQKGLETLWTVESGSALVVAFFLLWAVAATFCSYREKQPLNQWERGARCFFLGSLIALVLFFSLADSALGQLIREVEESGWNALPYRGEIAFVHPLLKKGGDEKQPLPETQEGLLTLMGSLARQTSARDYRLNQREAMLLWRLFRESEDMTATDPRSARFFATLLAFDRRWDLGCTEALAAKFRSQTLPYLATADSQSLEEYRAFLPLLAVRSNGGRERQDFVVLRMETHPLRIFGGEWDFCPPQLYYALDSTLFPLHNPLQAGFNPEQEALRAVLEIRGRQLATGALPMDYSVSSRLGEYRRTGPNKASLVLKEVDPVCRPSAAVEFAGQPGDR